MDSGDAANDLTAVFLNLSDAQELLVLEGRIHEIVVVADKLGGVRKLASKLQTAIDRPDLVVEPWQVFARSFYDAMMADKAGGWIMLVVIILVVAIGVLNTVLMSVLERTREYGLLRAVGTRPGQIFWLVIVEVSIMAVVSVAFGLCRGLGFELHPIHLRDPDAVRVHLRRDGIHPRIFRSQHQELSDTDRRRHFFSVDRVYPTRAPGVQNSARRGDENTLGGGCNVTLFKTRLAKHLSKQTTHLYHWCRDRRGVGVSDFCRRRNYRF